jgi:hypothetical protein
MTKYRDTYTYITEIEKNLGECITIPGNRIGIIYTGTVPGVFIAGTSVIKKIIKK